MKQEFCVAERKIEIENEYIYGCNKQLSYIDKECSKSLNITTSPGTLSEVNFTKNLAINYGPHGYSFFSGSQPNPRFYIYNIGIYWYGSAVYNQPIGAKIYIKNFQVPSHNGIYQITGKSGISTAGNWLVSTGGWISLKFLGSSYGSNLASYNSGYIVKGQTTEPIPKITGEYWNEVCDD